MQKQIKKYTIYACLIISFATYSFSLKEFNSIIVQAEEVTNGFNRRMINKAQAKEVSIAPKQAQIEEVELIEDTPQEDKSIEGKIREVFGNEAETALAVAMAESRMNPDAIGDKHLSKPSYGLFQISRIYHKYPIETLLDPDENIRIAKEISSKGRGFENWTTYRTGQYLEHLIK